MLLLSDIQQGSGKISKKKLIRFFNVLLSLTSKRQRAAERARALVLAREIARRWWAPGGQARPWVQSPGCGLAEASWVHSCPAGPTAT